MINPYLVPLVVVSTTTSTVIVTGYLTALGNHYWKTQGGLK